MCYDSTEESAIGRISSPQEELSGTSPLSSEGKE